MTEKLYWQVIGDGPDLVLIHGWGMNGAVWQQTCQRLQTQFRIHILDLPGYGYSGQSSAASLAEIAQVILNQAPSQAVWVGWSLGGLIATHIALHYPQRVTQLVTVASSPKFTASEQETPVWRGIKPQVLDTFTDQLLTDLPLMIERFIALQAMGSPSARQEIKALKQAVLARPMPTHQALLTGLNLLSKTDMRQQLTQLTMPVLRMYGRLDGLVPLRVAEAVRQLQTNSQTSIFQASSHAPFMTEQDAFCQQLLNFAK